MDDRICAKFKDVDRGDERFGICKKGGYSATNQFSVFALPKGNYGNQFMQDCRLFW